MMGVYYSFFKIDKYLVFRSQVFARYAHYAICLGEKNGRRVFPEVEDFSVSCQDECGWFDLMFESSEGQFIRIPMSYCASPISDIREWFEKIVHRNPTDDRLVTEHICDCEDDYYIFNFDQMNEYGDGIFTVCNTYLSRTDELMVESFACYCNYKHLIETVYYAIMNYWTNRPLDEYFSWSVDNRDVDDPAEVLKLIKSDIIESYIHEKRNERL